MGAVDNKKHQTKVGAVHKFCSALKLRNFLPNLVAQSRIELEASVNETDVLAITLSRNMGASHPYRQYSGYSADLVANRLPLRILPLPETTAKVILLFSLVGSFSNLLITFGGSVFIPIFIRCDKTGRFAVTIQLKTECEGQAPNIGVRVLHW